MVILAVVALVAAVLAYGVSGLALARGARGPGSPLAGRAWWVGTALQGVGFGLSLLARTVLPLLLVQSAIAAALAVTAVLEHLAAVTRLTRACALAVGAVTLGIAAIAVAVVPGPAREAPAVVVWALWAALTACAAATPRVTRAALLGALSGCAFGVSAVGARLLVGTGGGLDQTLRFWSWPAETWSVAVLVPAGIVVGQWALTLGLARGSSMVALGGDYLLATLLPSAVGLVLLGEQLRGGLWPVALAGLLAAGWGLRRLLDA